MQFGNKKSKENISKLEKSTKVAIQCHMLICKRQGREQRIKKESETTVAFWGHILE